MSIEVEGVTKRYGRVAVVSGVSLDIANGEMFVLLGPSGSGKSTLLRMIAGLCEVDEGRVLLDGRDVTDVSPSERGIGFVFQNYALFRNMTVAENVEFALRVRKVSAAQRRQRREHLLEIVGLGGFGERRPSQLSGGQQQRVALARALANEPPFLLLDEPFGALDAKIRVELRHTLRRIQRELNVTAVFVTHDQDEALELADRLGVMNRGRLLDVGAPEELYLRPRSAFVATFLGTSNFLVGEATPRSVRLGDVELPLGTETPARPCGERVQVLFRPEDLELAGSREDLRSTAIGRGTVEERSFNGPIERLRVRLDRIPGVRQISPAPAFGRPMLLLEVTRPQPDALARPLERADDVWIGARRAHVLASARVHITVPGPEVAVSPAREFATTLAAKLGGSVRHPGEEWPGPEVDHPPAAEAEPESFGLTAVDIDGNGALGAGAATAAGHLLAVPGPCVTPRRLLVCVAVGEPGKVDVRFAERLAWRLGAETTVLTVLPSPDAAIPDHVIRFLDASARALSVRGVRTRTRVRYGVAATEILAELAAGGHDMLVVGAPLRAPRERAPTIGAVVGRILREGPACPVLIVRPHQS